MSVGELPLKFFDLGLSADVVHGFGDPMCLAISDRRDCSLSLAILVKSPYRPRTTANALAIRCGIVDIGTRSVEDDQGIAFTIEHVIMFYAMRISTAEAAFEIVAESALIPEDRISRGDLISLRGIPGGSKTRSLMKKL